MRFFAFSWLFLQTAINHLVTIGELYFNFEFKTVNDISVSFTPNVNRSVISAFALDFLKGLLLSSGNTSATITSSARTPFEQAKAMYNNIEQHGVASQKALYATAGDTVMDVYVASKASGKQRDEILQDMTNKILEVGPSTVSRHSADFTKLVVVDIAPSSILNKAPWKSVLIETKLTFPGFNFILPGNDPAYHIEIPNGIEEMA